MDNPPFHCGLDVLNPEGSDGSGMSAGALKRASAEALEALGTGDGSKTVVYF